MWDMQISFEDGKNKYCTEKWYIFNKIMDNMLMLLNSQTCDILASVSNNYWRNYLVPDLIWFACVTWTRVGTLHSLFFFQPADFAGWTSADITSSPREPLRTCEEHCCVHIHTGFSRLFEAIFTKYCHLMIIESRNMESSEDEALLGAESEDENSELSDSEVSSS